MRFIYDHDLHIHSRLSACSGDQEQSPERILRYAKDNGLKKICLTDHYWDDRIPGASNWYQQQNTEWIKQSLPLPKADDIMSERELFRGRGLHQLPGSSGFYSRCNSNIIIITKS